MTSTVKIDAALLAPSVQEVTVEEFEKLRLAANHHTALRGDPFYADVWLAESFPHGIRIIRGEGEKNGQ